MNSLSVLWMLPVCTYVLSYIYLAGYHHKLSLFHTIVHEGGTYTFLQTLFYASHFWGHVPMLTVLAFFFTGCVLCLTVPKPNKPLQQQTRSILLILSLFLCGIMVLSVAGFGWPETWAFISQKKQSVVTYAQGGAWDLHLPSTVMQFFLMPVYVYVAKKVFRRTVSPNNSGAAYLLGGTFLLIVGTIAFNQNNFRMLLSIGHDPRYLAHSVRELVTFPLIFYPLPLYATLKYAQEPDTSTESKEGRLWIVMAVLAVIFLVEFCYQALVPLSQGIGSLAQKPDFARGGHLSVVYLLASHYFEHFLDTIYFFLLCLLLYSWGALKHWHGLRCHEE